MKWIWDLCIANMKQRGIRTVLTVLGVVIGIISIVSLLGIGIGVKRELVDTAEETGSMTEIKIYGVTDGKRKDRMLTDRRLEELGKLDHVETIYPALGISSSMSYGNYEGYWEIVGVPREYLQQKTLQYGTYPEDSGYKPELLMGNHIMDMFYSYSAGTSYTETYGEEVDVSGEAVEVQFSMSEDQRGQRMTISGIIEDDPYALYCDIDNLKMYLKRITAGDTIPGQPVDQNGENYREWIYSNAIIKVDDVENVDELVKILQERGYQTINDKEYIDSIQRMVKIVQILLGGIGMIALIVAVIGIGNTMTTAVYDRIQEIGVLKVLGCEPDELLYLFLLESGILGGLGGLIGILVSYGITGLLINRLAVSLMKLPKGTILAVIPPWLAVAAFFFAIILGVLAGFFPARWAARLRPIQAVQRQ